MTLERVMTVILEGKPGTSMPAWRALDNTEIADVGAYVWSLGDSGR